MKTGNRRENGPPPSRSKNTVRFGIIGCGSIAEHSFGPSLLASQRNELAAVCRRDLSAARDFADRFGGPRAYASAAELVRDEQVQAVIVSTPTDTHRDYTCLAAEHGKHVLCGEADGEGRCRVPGDDGGLPGQRRHPGGRLPAAHLPAGGRRKGLDRLRPHRPRGFCPHPLQRALGPATRGLADRAGNRRCPDGDGLPPHRGAAQLRRPAAVGERRGRHGRPRLAGRRHRRPDRALRGRRDRHALDDPDLAAAPRLRPDRRGPRPNPDRPAGAECRSPAPGAAGGY